ncbi:MAG TPA: glycoside hydrolase family 75 protein [Polyangiaceae bacterium]|nr:glycoside hydrolase family 75 protein [Polyangiaceae bacterium]
MATARPARGTCTALRVAFTLTLAASGCSSGKVSVGDDRLVDAGPFEAGANAPSAASLLPLVASCSAASAISDGALAPESGRAADVFVCGLSNAVFWRSEFAVDCDGKITTTCNGQTDPQSQPNTVGKDSAGNSLDPTLVPYVEVPAPSAVFDYHAAGLSMGSVAAVIYKDQLAYGVLGQEQAAGVIGAGSYKLAELLGIDPDPVKGGLESEVVTYIAFTGASHVVPALQDESTIDSTAEMAARDLIATGH